MHIFGEHHGIGKGCSILLLSIFISYLLKPFVSLDFVGCHRDSNFFWECFVDTLMGHLRERESDRRFWVNLVFSTRNCGD